MTVSETSSSRDISRSRVIGLVAEFVAIFLALPSILAFHATRLNVHVALWLTGLYGIFILTRSRGFSWRVLWRGEAWPLRNRKIAALFLLAATALIILLASFLVPGRMFIFPMQRPFFWMVVMVLYPLLSVTPQEFVLRSFFFRRYAVLFPKTWMQIAMSSFCFGYVHIVLGNPVAPILSFLGGILFAYSYSRHRSLKWVALEHAAYGCMIFTVGLGPYFLVGGLKP